MFEQEIEMEKKEGSSFGPILIIFLLVGLFLGGIGVVVFQSKQTIKPEEATALVQSRLASTGAVSVSFHTGNVSYGAADKPSDPQYKLLQNAGILKVSKGKGYAAQVDLTPAGKELIASIPDAKGTPDKDGTVAYSLLLAKRKLVAVGPITKQSQQKFLVQYTWSWETTKVGEMFDVAGKLVQSLPSYERGMLIDQHGANYYHAAPARTSLAVVKGDKGWEAAN